MTPKQNGYGVIKFKSLNTGEYHNRLRMLKDHLSVEPQAVNCSRVACCNRNTYQGHGGISTMPPTFKI